METPPKKKLKIDPRSTKSEKSNNSTKKTSKKETCHPSFNLKSCDFSKIVGSSGFVDKSLLIKALFENTCKVLITAPKRFGKSTNLDMVKRFLEIEVDSSGRPIDVSQSNNYKLFWENKLKICEHEQFCKVHLGRHPVMIIDYKGLSIAVDFDSMLTEFKAVVRKTFEYHHYLLDVNYLWSGSLKLERFKSYIDPDQSKHLSIYEIKSAFNFLAEVLHKYFGKPVFLLIDEYDACIESFIFKDNTDYSRIINFIQSTNADLLKSSNHIDHALLTGVFRISSEGLALTFSQCLNGIIHYKFLHKHPFHTYYGITSKECESLLNLFIQDCEAKKKYKRTIDKYFNGYNINGVKFYCTWSVLKFFENNKKIRNGSSRDESIFDLKKMLRHERISENFLHLLCGKCLDINISKQFSRSNIKDISSLFKLTGQEISEETLDLLFCFLFHLGFLSIVDMKKKDIASIKIPNQEIIFQFANIFKESYEIKYKFKSDKVKHFQSVVNSFNVTGMNDEKFLELSNSLNTLISNTTYLHKKDNLIHILFVFLACRFSFIESDQLMTSKSDYQYFVTVNDHDVALIIGSVIEKLETPVPETVLNIHNLLIQNNNFCHIEKKLHKKLKGKVYIIFETSDNKISMSYSFIIKDKEITLPKFI